VCPAALPVGEAAPPTGVSACGVTTSTVKGVRAAAGPVGVAISRDAARARRIRSETRCHCRHVLHRSMRHTCACAFMEANMLRSSKQSLREHTGARHRTAWSRRSAADVGLRVSWLDERIIMTASKSSVPPISSRMSWQKAGRSLVPALRAQSRMVFACLGSS